LSNKPNMKLRIGPILCHLFYPSGKPENSRSYVARGSSRQGGTSPPVASALKPSNFCNDRVNKTETELTVGYLKEILPKMGRYALARKGITGPGTPLNLTFSVTNLCQSRCRTCSIWKLYKEHPERRETELSTGEIEKVFRSMGHVYVFNVSGGEPFLRPDFTDIIGLACRHLTPGIIHIPTNGIAVDRIETGTRRILDILGKHAPHTRLTVKPSLDHIGDKHDRIRGVAGNFDRMLETFERLKALKPAHPQLHVELGTVISRFNVEEIAEIAGFASRLGADSYRSEIAEQRSEMFNRLDAITPGPVQYEKAIDFFTGQVHRHMRGQAHFQRITQAFRLVYYDLAVAIMKTDRQVIPCYGGISNAHLTPYGDIWPCCTLGYEKSMGNLRDCGYDFKRLWTSPEAARVRRFIGEKRCACPLANQSYSNILMHPPSLARVLGLIAGWPGASGKE
jgi:MoaA/NifB/PqqE/SkfB family radical SAM enzyme